MDWKDSAGSRKMYYCRTCGHDHRRNSKKGKAHYKKERITKKHTKSKYSRIKIIS